MRNTRRFGQGHAPKAAEGYGKTVNTGMLQIEMADPKMFGRLWAGAPAGHAESVESFLDQLNQAMQIALGAATPPVQPEQIEPDVLQRAASQPDTHPTGKGQADWATTRAEGEGIPVQLGQVHVRPRKVNPVKTAEAAEATPAEETVTPTPDLILPTYIAASLPQGDLDPALIVPGNPDERGDRVAEARSAVNDGAVTSPSSPAPGPEGSTSDPVPVSNTTVLAPATALLVAEHADPRTSVSEVVVPPTWSGDLKSIPFEQPKQRASIPASLPGPGVEMVSSKHTEPQRCATPDGTPVRNWKATAAVALKADAPQPQDQWVLQPEPAKEQWPSQTIAGKASEGSSSLPFVSQAHTPTSGQPVESSLPVPQASRAGENQRVEAKAPPLPEHPLEFFPWNAFPRTGDAHPSSEKFATSGPPMEVADRSVAGSSRSHDPRGQSDPRTPAVADAVLDLRFINSQGADAPSREWIRTGSKNEATAADTAGNGRFFRGFGRQEATSAAKPIQEPDRRQGERDAATIPAAVSGVEVADPPHPPDAQPAKMQDANLMDHCDAAHALEPTATPPHQVKSPSELTAPGERHAPASPRLLDSRPGVPFEAHPGRIVESAHLADRAGQCEMRIELRTEAWGAVSIRAVVRENHLGAAIGVEGREAQSILMSELPRLEQSLAARDVRLDHLEVSPGPMGGGNGERGRNFENAAPRHDPAESKPVNSLFPTIRGTTPIHPPAHESGMWGRLSIMV